MKTIKTAEAEGPALDWLVAKAFVTDACIFKIKGGKVFDRLGLQWEPTTNWSQGGPIFSEAKIESRWIILDDKGRGYWQAANLFTGTYGGIGPTELIAKARCYVASRLGETVEVPEELCTPST